MLMGRANRYRFVQMFDANRQVIHLIHHSEAAIASCMGMLRRCALGNLSHGDASPFNLPAKNSFSSPIFFMSANSLPLNRSERLLDAEHQIDMRHGIPAFDIGGFHLIAQLKRIIVEYLAKDFFSIDRAAP